MYSSDASAEPVCWQPRVTSMPDAGTPWFSGIGAQIAVCTHLPSLPSTKKTGYASKTSMLKRRLYITYIYIYIYIDVCVLYMRRGSLQVVCWHFHNGRAKKGACTHLPSLSNTKKTGCANKTSMLKRCLHIIYIYIYIYIYKCVWVMHAPRIAAGLYVGIFWSCTQCRISRSSRQIFSKSVCSRKTGMLKRCLYISNIYIIYIYIYIYICVCVCYTCTADRCGFVCWHFQNGGNSKPLSMPLCRELIILL